MRLLTVLSFLIVLLLTNAITPTSFSMENDTVVFLNVTAVRKEPIKDDSVAPTTVSNILQGDYWLESELIQNFLQSAYMGGFNAITWLENLQPSNCLQVCLDEVASMLEQPFAGQRSLDEAGNICSHFDVFQRCLHHNTSCKNALLDVTTTVFDYLCTVEQEAFDEVLPCLYSHSTVIYYTCDNQCKLGELLSKASKESKVDDVNNLYDNNGNKLLEVPKLYNLCSASACFINCTEQKSEKKCSLSHSSLPHRIVAAIVKHTLTMDPAPEMKSSDAYALLVSSILPQECQRLKLLPKDIVLPASMTSFVDDGENVDDDKVVQHKSADSGENDAIRTILSTHGNNQTKSIYVQTFPLNGHQMKLQCQLFDLETGLESTVDEIAKLMTTAAKNIFDGFGSRNNDDEMLDKYRVKYGDMPGFADRRPAGERNEVNLRASSSHRSFLPAFLILPLTLFIQMN